MDAEISKWNLNYTQSGQNFNPPIQVLTENDFLLPATGIALDWR
jgi:hypothetical protein